MNKNTENMQNPLILSPKENLTFDELTSIFPDFPPSDQSTPIVPLSDTFTPLISLQDLLSLMDFCAFPVLITGLGEVCYWHGNQVTLEEFKVENDYILKEYGDKKVFSIGQTSNNNIIIVLSHTSGKF